MFVALVPLICLFANTTMCETRFALPDGRSFVFPFETEVQSVVNEHYGYSLHYWNLDKLSSTKPAAILFITGYDTLHPYKTLIANLNISDEDPWTDTYGTWRANYKANEKYKAHYMVKENFPLLKDLPVFVFNSRNSTAGAKIVAESLADAVKNINSKMQQAGIGDQDQDNIPDYTLMVAADDTAGVWTRVMFVQEASALGVDQLITLDSPHKGAIASDMASLQLGLLLFNSAGAKQLAVGSAEFNQFMPWLEGQETESFLTAVVDPIDTVAVAFSNGEQPWRLTLGEYWNHELFHKVSSTIDLSYVESMLESASAEATIFFQQFFNTTGEVNLSLGDLANRKSDFVPYHSAIMVDLPYNTGGSDHLGWVNYEMVGFLENEMTYKSTHSRYFDRKVSLLEKDLDGNDIPSDYMHRTVEEDGALVVEKQKFILGIMNDYFKQL